MNTNNIEDVKLHSDIQRYTDEQILNLTNEQIQEIIKLKCIEEGIKVKKTTEYSRIYNENEKLTSEYEKSVKQLQDKLNQYNDIAKNIYGYIDSIRTFYNNVNKHYTNIMNDYYPLINDFDKALTLYNKAYGLSLDIEKAIIKKHKEFLTKPIIVD